MDEFSYPTYCIKSLVVCKERVPYTKIKIEGGNLMFKEYTGNQQFDLQINRLIGGKIQNDARVAEDVREIIPNLTDTQNWFHFWEKQAVKRERNGEFDLAATYYQAAEFYMEPNDPKKDQIYEKYVKNFDKSFDRSAFTSYNIPYKHSFLPAVTIGENSEELPVIFFTGYDSYLEEVMPVLAPVQKLLNRKLIIFEGPGQGRALRNGLKFIPNWETPMKVVLDYFQLDSADIVGVSWGGYFAIRAAAFEKRIHNVICFDIFYSGLDYLHANFCNEEFNLLLEWLETREEAQVNQLVTSKMTQDLDLKWKIQKGMENTKEETPYDVLQNLKKHTVENILPFVNQNVLLLAGEEDQYVPIERLEQMEQGLINAASITSQVFTKATGGEQHCQAGAMHLAFEAINQFLMEKQ